jgi:hypothetical protein
LPTEEGEEGEEGEQIDGEQSIDRREKGSENGTGEFYPMTMQVKKMLIKTKIIFLK